jgi:signal transduction histidine kinase
LLDTHEAMVARARLEAGNLAHSLRTSLAILTDEAETLRKGEAGESAATLLEQCRRIERQLDWHLARTRSGPRPGAVTRIPEGVVPIMKAMERLHAGRGLDWTIALSPAATLAIAPDDFAEILSNLADNAGKWARTRVVVGWDIAGPDARIAVTDDGPGIPEEQRAMAFDAGNRLDERTPGHGLGLAIARDMARQHGGDIALEGREDGDSGLVAVLSLPLSAP